MLRTTNSLIGHSIHATDGDLGKVTEFFFDDVTWRIRYMVVETGGWLSGRKVLISPIAMKKPDWDSKILPVALTREQVRKSPDIDTKKTVSRQHELELAGHYNWPSFWGELYTGFPFIPAQEETPKAEEEKAVQNKKGDPHLRSTRQVAGYRFHATDGQIGSVDNYIVDDEKWVIRYLVADISPWLPGRKILVSPNWIERVEWDTSEVFVNLTREAVRKSPEFNPLQPVSPDYERTLYNHYGRTRE